MLSRQSGQLAIWLMLLGLAELADLITTHADRLRGGAEANAVAVIALAAGGPALFWALKLGLVVVMAAVVLLVVRFGRAHPGRRAAKVKAFTMRALQLCVLVLTVTAAANVGVLAWLSSRGGG